MAGNPWIRQGAIGGTTNLGSLGGPIAFPPPQEIVGKTEITVTGNPYAIADFGPWTNDGTGGINAAIALASGSGGVVKLLGPTHNVTVPLIFPPIAQNSGNSLIRLTAVPGTIVYFNVPSGSACALLNLNGIQAPEIENIWFQWQSGVTTLFLTSGTITGGFKLIRCQIDGFAGVGLNDMAHLLIDPWFSCVNFVGCGYGIRAGGNSHWKYERCVFVTNSAAGLDTSIGTNHTMIGCEFSDNLYNISNSDTTPGQININIYGGAFDVGAYPFFNKLGTGTPTWIGTIHSGYITTQSSSSTIFFDFLNNGYGVFDIEGLQINTGAASIMQINLGNNVGVDVHMRQCWFNNTLAIVINGTSRNYVATTLNYYIDHIWTLLPLPTTQSVGLSPWTYVNTTGGRTKMLISGGTVTGLTYYRNGTGYAMNPATGSIEVENSDYVSVAYSSMPTVYTMPVS